MMWLLKDRRFLALAATMCAALVLGVVLLRSGQGPRSSLSHSRDSAGAENGSTPEQGQFPALSEEPATPEVLGEERPFDGYHVNAGGGYAFSHPTGWTVRETGTLTELLSADEEIAISFGLGPPGGIEAAYDNFVSLIDESYDEASVRAVRADQVEGSLRVKLIGTATTEAGLQIWFTGRVIAPPGDQSLGTLAAGPLESRDTGRASANEILDSFKPIARGEPS
ncbi:MAG: hypothetical protein M3124_07990 [Actinomycetota bacterium]|nr:hypothetical protein [Actinomycetota bacterium]